MLPPQSPRACPACLNSDGCCALASLQKRDDEAADEVKFDEFMGNDAGMFANFGEYDEDDKEADKIWESIDNFMDERRRVRKWRTPLKLQADGCMVAPAAVACTP